MSAGRQFVAYRRVWATESQSWIYQRQPSRD